MHNLRQYLFLGLAPVAYATCECGYETNTQELFQYALLTDFNGTDLAAFQNSTDWEISSIVYAKSTSRPYATNYTASNVNVANDSLLLSCSAYDATTSSVASAQVESSRYDILYGSFRAQYRVQSTSSGAGAISGFFFYANDTAEVDIELLTRDDARDVVFTNQPDESTDVYMPNLTTRSDLNDYRFDWTSNYTKFFVNNVLSDSKTTDVPSINGSIYLNMWGGSTYAGDPPPSSDVAMSISAIQLYFNTSDTTLAKSWAQTCASTKAAICSADSQSLQQNATGTVAAGVAATTAKSAAVSSRGMCGPSCKMEQNTKYVTWAAIAGAALLNLDV